MPLSITKQDEDPKTKKEEEQTWGYCHVRATRLYVGYI